MSSAFICRGRRKTQLLNGFPDLVCLHQPPLRSCPKFFRFEPVLKCSSVSNPFHLQFLRFFLTACMRINRSCLLLVSRVPPIRLRKFTDYQSQAWFFHQDTLMCACYPVSRGELDDHLDFYMRVRARRVD